MQPRDLFRCLIGPQIHSKPTIAISSYAFESRQAFAAENNRHATGLCRFGIAARVLETHELSGKSGFWLSPQRAHRFNVFAGPLCTSFERNAQRSEFFRRPTDPDP